MAVNITSGLTGKYLVQRSKRWMKQAKTELRDEGLADSEIEQQLFWNSLAAGLVRKWRTIHLPIALAFAVLATAPILSTFLDRKSHVEGTIGSVDVGAGCTRRLKNIKTRKT